MKIQTLLLTGLLALAGLGTVRAEHTDSGVLHLYMTGSTAYRNQVVSALLHKMGGSAADGAISSSVSAGRRVIYDNVKDAPSAKEKATRAIFYTSVPADFGVSGGGVTAVIVKYYWGGSTGGIKNVAGSETAVGKFLDDSVLDLSNGALDGAYTHTTASDNNANSNDTSITDIALGDTYQATTPFTGIVSTNDGTYDLPDYQDHTYETLQGAASGGSDGIIGVIPFVWIKSYCSTTAFDGLTNLTPSLCQKLWAGTHGTTLAQFSGGSAAADLANLVLPTGRDPDSGTRLSAFAENGIGAGSLSVLQRKPQSATNASGETITSANFYFPAGTVINGITCDAGQSGEASGGTLRKLMNLNANGFNLAAGHPATFVTYVGSGDAKDAVNDAHPATVLSWNGVFIGSATSTANSATDVSGTLDATNLKNGKYTFWSYEHMFYRSGATTQAKQAADAIAARVYSNDAQIKVTDMKCKRDGDGQPVYPNYAF